MKKFAQEVVTYFWIPLIMALVSYIFFQLKDVILGIIVLVGLSAVYTLVRLYFIHKKWWLMIILVVVLFVSVGAYFLRAPDITLTINGEKVTGVSLNLASGSVSISPAPQASGLYTKGTKVTLTAHSGSGSDFKGWTGTNDDAANPTTVTMDKNKQLKLNFESRFSLIINNQPIIGTFVNLQEGSVTINPPPDSDGKYKSGVQVQLSVKANTGYDFTGWSGTSSDTANPTSVVMSGGNRNITVNFEGRFALYISNQMVISSTVMFAEGSATVSPAPDEDGQYAYGTKITLTATPNTGYGWKFWSGTATDAANPATVTIKGEKHIAVTFEQRYLININGQPLTGATLSVTGGSLASEPAPGTDARYVKDSITVLSATPLAGYRFGKWGGDVTDTVTSVSLSMNTNKNITVTFIKTWVLTTGKNVPAGGSVTPASGTYDTESSVTITAAPATGYRFDKWTGDVSGSVVSVTIIMTGDKTVTANFIKTYNLSIIASPGEGGTVTPASGDYDDGTTVTLTALPKAGYVFDHWSGSVSDNATVSTNVTMSADQDVTAFFVTSP
jgi:uncharacterized repeat protein (TIGR02543 family)